MRVHYVENTSKPDTFICDGHGKRKIETLDCGATLIERDGVTACKDLVTCDECILQMALKESERDENRS